MATEPKLVSALYKETLTRRAGKAFITPLLLIMLFIGVSSLIDFFSILQLYIVIPVYALFALIAIYTAIRSIHTSIRIKVCELPKHTGMKALVGGILSILFAVGVIFLFFIKGFIAQL